MNSLDLMLHWCNNNVLVLTCGMVLALWNVHDMCIWWPRLRHGYITRVQAYVMASTVLWFGAFLVTAAIIQSPVALRPSREQLGLYITPPNTVASSSPFPSSPSPAATFTSWFNTNLSYYLGDDWANLMPSSFYTCVLLAGLVLGEFTLRLLVPSAFQPILPEAFGALQPLAPLSRQEGFFYFIMSVSAGIVEEYVFRFVFPFVIQHYYWSPALAAKWASFYYFDVDVSATGLVPPLFLSALCFGIAHSYQGPLRMFTSFALSFIFFTPLRIYRQASYLFLFFFLFSALMFMCNHSGLTFLSFFKKMFIHAFLVSL